MRYIFTLTLSIFLIWLGKWGYIIYKSYESFLPDVSIPLTLQTGYKYEFEYIPPDASLKQQIPILELEMDSYDKTYKLYRNELIGENNFNIKNGNNIINYAIYSPPIIKINVFNNGELLNDIIVYYDYASSMSECRNVLSNNNNRCYKYLPESQQGEPSEMYFKSGEKYLIMIEVLYADPKTPNLKSGLILGGGHFFKKYRF